MNILFATACASKNAGGVLISVSQLAQAIAIQENTIKVVSVEDERGIEDFNNWRPLRPKLCSTYPLTFGYRPSMEMFRELNYSHAEIFHVHGIRTWPSLASRIVARRKGTPYVISPHGQLDSWVMQQARFKKWILHMLVENRTLRLADALHATCIQEYKYIRALGFRNPVILLPNGINIEEYERSSGKQMSIFWPEIGGRKVLLYLSLIYPKKGLDMLALAWNRLCEKFPDWVLVVAGYGNVDYQKIVKKMFSLSCSRGQTIFAGACYGEKKSALFSGCSVFILPTYSENFGNVVLEAMASKKPVITTKGAPWQCLESEQAGWWVEVDTEKISEAIEVALSLPEEELASMGKRGFRYAVKNFAWEQLAEKMLRSYGYLVGNNRCPDCFIED